MPQSLSNILVHLSGAPRIAIRGCWTAFVRRPMPSSPVRYGNVIAKPIASAVWRIMSISRCGFRAPWLSQTW